eukprot:TRINITY_DN20093_c0_g7_i1.p1 TRINITY_DN20093_c0_g7~~TRINITY_DN20093_c0_g7_i1.p1  ORF type:complete len:448 (+),score=56.70 TRINITY_DN20093_c0_g7_i1:97-1344(+)
MAVMNIIATAALAFGADSAFADVGVASTSSSGEGLALIQMNAGQIGSVPRHCRHISKQLQLHMNEFQSLGQHGSIDQCFWEASKTMACRNHARMNGNSFMIIYEDNKCSCKTSHASALHIVRKNAYSCTFPYPEQECTTVSRYERFTPTQNSSYLKLPEAMDFEECMWMAMASDKCNKQAESANGVYSTLFGIDYCYCAVADDTPTMLKNSKVAGGQNYLCTAISKPSPTRSLRHSATPTRTTLHLPMDRFTDLLQQGDTTIRARGGPQGQRKLNYIFAVAVNIHGRETVLLEQALGHLDAKHPLMKLTANNVTSYASKHITTMSDSLLVNSTRSKVVFHHKPSGLEFVVSSEKTKRRNVTNSHHLNLRIIKGVVMSGLGKAKGALPQIWGTQPLSSEVRTFIRHSRQRPTLHHS